MPPLIQEEMVKMIMKGEIHRITLNSASLIIARALSAIILYWSDAYAARHLGANSIGLYYWSLYITSYITIVCGLGMAAIGQREVAKYPIITRKMISSVISLQIILAVMGFFGLIGWSALCNGLHSETIILSIVGMNVVFNSLRPTWILQAHQRMALTPLISLLTDAMQASIVVLLVRNTSDSYSYAAISLLSQFLKINFEWWYLGHLNIASIRAFTFSKRGWFPIIRASLPIAISRGAVSVYYTLDAVIIGLFYGDAAVGLYGSAYSLMLALTVPCIAILTSFEPVLASSYRQSGDKTRGVSLQFTKILCWIGFPLTAVAFVSGRAIYTTIYGADFEAGAGYFQWLTLNIALIYINVSLANPLIAWGYQRQHMNITLLSAALNISLNFAIIPIMHIYGAVIATVASEVFVFSVTYFYRRLKHLFWFPLYRVLFLPVLFSMIILIFGKWLQLK
ncbi:flippase [Consotaella aegiceratis]|uniref:flippase n=1 Tax=Consotaella aegiceratis TaxID=3097961 RepID=UPI002F4024AA